MCCVGMLDTLGSGIGLECVSAYLLSVVLWSFVVLALPAVFVPRCGAVDGVVGSPELLAAVVIVAGCQVPKGEAQAHEHTAVVLVPASEACRVIADAGRVVERHASVSKPQTKRRRRMPASSSESRVPAGAGPAFTPARA